MNFNLNLKIILFFKNNKNQNETNTSNTVNLKKKIHPCQKRTPKNVPILFLGKAHNSPNFCTEFCKTKLYVKIKGQLRFSWFLFMACACWTCLKHTMNLGYFNYLAKFNVSFRKLQQVQVMNKTHENRRSPLCLIYI